MRITGKTVVEKDGYTRDKMYIDDVKKDAIFDFFRENAPFGVGYGASEEAVKNYQFKENDMYYSKEEGKMKCYFTPAHRNSFGNVCAGFAFDDFTCEYYDNTANKVDLSHNWCKFVCAELDSVSYFMDYLTIMKEKVNDLKVEHSRQLNEIYDQIADVSIIE